MNGGRRGRHDWGQSAQSSSFFCRIIEECSLLTRILLFVLCDVLQKQEQEGKGEEEGEGEGKGERGERERRERTRS